jgi:uncharacterized protein YlxP (DUF503 family)
MSKKRIEAAPSSVAVGVARVVLHLPESGSLKSKRQVVSGLLRRLRQELKVTAAEVGELDRWQLAELAIATVSADPRQADRVLAAALSYIESHADGARITDVSTELVRL